MLMKGTCALAKERLASYVARLKASPRVEQVTTGIKAGYIATPLTMLKAPLGNTPWGALLQLGRQPLSVALDHVVSVGRSAATFGKVKPHEFRSLASALDAEGIAIMGRAFNRGLDPFRNATRAARKAQKSGSIRDGIRAWIDELRVTLDAEGISRTVDLEGTVYKQGSVMQYATDLAFGLLEAADRPFWKLAHDSSIYAQAKLLGIRQGLKGKALKAEAKRLFESPTEEMALRAVEDANYATFKDRGQLAHIASDMKAGLRRRSAEGNIGATVGSYVVETNLPFTGVPSSIAMKSMVDLTPLGLVKALGKQLSPESRGQAGFLRDLSTAGIGTAAMALGYALMKEGKITLGRPQGTEAGVADVERRQPYSVLIDGEWRDIRFALPVAMPLFLGAKLAEITEKEPETSKASAALRTTAFAGKVMTEQTYLQGVKRIMDAATDESGKKGVSLLASQVPDPSILGQVARGVDPVERDAQTLGEKIQASVPFASRALPARLTPFGQEQRRDNGLVGSMLDPTRSRTATETPVSGWLRRLGVGLPQLPKWVQIGGTKVPLRHEEWEALVRMAGPVMERELAELVSSQDYLDLDDEGKRRALRDLIEDIRREAMDYERERRAPKGSTEP
jgi:hypothetical protein